MKQKIFIAAAAFLLTIALGFCMIFFVQLLPQGRVEQYIRESAEEIIAEGDYYSLIPDQPWTMLDNYTDKIMLLISAGTREKTALEKTLQSWRTYLKDGKGGESFRVFGLPDTGEWALHGYSRYWHGYQVLVRPLLLFFNYTQIRLLNGLIVLLEIAGIIFLHMRRGKRRYLPAFLLLIYTLSPETIANSLQNSTIFHVTMGAVLILLAADERRLRRWDWLFFLLLGMSVSYVDLLTYPMAALVVPLSYGCILLWEGEVFAGKLKGLIRCGILWGVGYAGMWASKWVLATVILRENFIAKALRQIMVRTGDTIDGQKTGYREVLTALWSAISGKGIAKLLLVFGLGMLILCLRRRPGRKQLWTAALLSCLSLIPFLWWGLTKNHSCIHTFFTHRGFGAVVFCVAAALAALPGEKVRR